MTNRAIENRWLENSKTKKFIGLSNINFINLLTKFVDKISEDLKIENQD